MSRNCWPSWLTMRSTISIYRLLVAGLLIAIVLGCGRPDGGPSEERAKSETGAVDPRGVDPLELASDREVIPAVQPRAGDITGRDALVQRHSTESETDGTEVPHAVLQADSVNSQAYRVQVHTGTLFSEARSEVAIAEEIFDQPVYLDYEVPYFKVRVGSFADRDAAEQYRQRAKGAGYANAWVVLVNVNVRGAAPLYEGLPTLPPDTLHPGQPGGASDPDMGPSED
jgi:hypothetical protein